MAYNNSGKKQPVTDRLLPRLIILWFISIVEITVEDQNDNRPVFSNGPTTLPVPNNVQIGKTSQ